MLCCICMLICIPPGQSPLPHPPTTPPPPLPLCFNTTQIDQPQSHHPPDVDQPDQTGVTIRDLLQASNSSTPLLQYLTSKQTTAAAGAAAGGGGQGRHRTTSHQGQVSSHAGAEGSSSSDGSRGDDPGSDAEWRARLQEEMSDEDVGGIGWAR